MVVVFVVPSPSRCLPFPTTKPLPIWQPHHRHQHYSHKRLSCSRLQQISVASESSHGHQHPNNNNNNKSSSKEVKSTSKIQVPRQKHIPVSKSQLLEAILSIMLHQDAAHHFRLLTSCLDTILHAEHKTILEEMRSDYHLSNSPQTLVTNQHTSDYANNGNGNVYQEDMQQLQPQNSMLSDYALNLGTLLRSLDPTPNNDYHRASRVTIATRFQRSFMQLLSDAQFEELSARDLMLTSALNTDYLLTLPIYVDWEKAYQSNAIIFRNF